MDSRAGISLVGFKNPDSIRLFHEEQCLQKENGPCFELSYQWDSKQTAGMSFLKGHILSGHVPCPGGTFLPNLGSRNRENLQKSLNVIRKSAGITASFGGQVLVLHAGYTMDDLVYREYRLRQATLDALPGELGEVWLKKGTVCRADYTAIPAYRKYLFNTIENLIRAKELCRAEGINLAVENLNPRITYLFQTIEEFDLLLKEIPDIHICLDLGHLWISSLVHDFNFIEGVEAFLNTERVITTHIHDNASTLTPEIYIGDDHSDLGTGRIPLNQAVNLIASKSRANMVIETKANPLENYNYLRNLLR